MATQKLLVEVSVVRKRREPHMCVAELTSQVECKPKTVRRKHGPHHDRQAAKGERDDGEHCDRHPMVLC